MHFKSLSISFLICAGFFGCGPKTINLESEPQIPGASFVGPDRVWLTTLRGGEILRTEDGGKHWTKVNVPGVRFEQVAFLDQLRGWAVSDDGRVWKSADGGRTWSAIGDTKATADSHYYKAVQLNFVDERFGWMIDPFSVWCTHDGGVNWAQCFSSVTPGRGEGWPVAYFYLNSRYAWIAASNGEVYRTQDGGLNWQRVKINSETDFDAIQFVDEREGWLAGWPNGGIYHTSDGGITWERQLEETAKNNIAIDSLSFINKTEGWAVGRIWPVNITREKTRGVVLHTTNGGKDWRPVEIASNEPVFVRVHFTDNQHGWLVSLNKVYRTEDAGKSWSAVLELPGQRG